MQGMRKNAKWKMVLPAALILTLMFAFAAFGAEEAAAEYVPEAYGTIWAGLDYQGGIQLFVCGNFSRFYSVFRNEF